MAKPTDEYKLNEPKAKIPGGSTRASVRVDRENLGAVRDRERIEKVLTVHDLDGTRAPLSLKEKDGPILRTIARETIASSVQPALRAKAIAGLAQFPNPENLNTLFELAAFGDDVYVRSHALIALGSTGLLASAGQLAKALRATENIERTAAAKGLWILAGKVGLSTVQALLPEERDRKLLRVLSDAAAKRKTGKASRSSAKKRTLARPQARKS
jgi:HEAT repeat protein